MDYIRPSRSIIEKIDKPHHGGNVWNYSDINIIDFSSNVNPLGPPDDLVKVLKTCLLDLSSYPPIDGMGAREAISRHFKIPPENIHLGNGSSEIIKNFCDGYIRKGDQVIILEPTFSEYEYYSRLYGAHVVHASPREDFTHEIDRIIGSINNKTRVIFVCNPNNPTGTLFDSEDLVKLLEFAKDRGILVFLDEAYIHFSPGETLISQFTDYSNLVVLHSLTKFFSIPGLRIGFCVASLKIIETLEKVRPPWNVNYLAQKSVKACLEDSAFIEKTGRFIEEERNFLLHKLKKLDGIKVIPSQANFFIIDISQKGKSREIKEQLLEKGLLLRDCSSFYGMGQKYLRLCIGKREENLILLRALEGL